MDDSNRPFTRWYDEDDIVSKCISTLESLQDSFKRQTATYLMEEIIDKPPYNDMLPVDVFNMVTSETRKRRWYDYDEVMRIFVELLRYCSPGLRRKVAVIAISFIEDLVLDKVSNPESVSIEATQENFEI